MLGNIFNVVDVIEPRKNEKTNTQVHKNCESFLPWFRHSSRQQKSHPQTNLGSFTSFFRLSFEKKVESQLRILKKKPANHLGKTCRSPAKGLTFSKLNSKSPTKFEGVKGIRAY